HLEIAEVAIPRADLDRQPGGRQEIDDLLIIEGGVYRLIGVVWMLVRQETAAQPAAGDERRQPVERKEPGRVRDRHDELPARRQHAPNLGEARRRDLEMFERLRTEDHVEHAGRERQSPREVVDDETDRAPAPRRRGKPRSREIDTGERTLGAPRRRRGRPRAAPGGRSRRRRPRSACPPPASRRPPSRRPLPRGSSSASPPGGASAGGTGRPPRRTAAAPRAGGGRESAPGGAAPSAGPPRRGRPPLALRRRPPRPARDARAPRRRRHGGRGAPLSAR